MLEFFSKLIKINWGTISIMLRFSCNLTCSVGEPNNAGGQEWCVELLTSKDNKWNDHSCTQLNDGYICKKRGTG